MAGDQQKLTEGASIQQTPAPPTPEPHPFIADGLLCATCNAIEARPWHTTPEPTPAPERTAS
jgi:hypothetical protein